MVNEHKQTVADAPKLRIYVQQVPLTWCQHDLLRYLNNYSKHTYRQTGDMCIRLGHDPILQVGADE